MPRNAPLHDRRAQSVEIASLFGFLIVVAMLWMFVEPAFDNILGVAANETTNSTAQKGNSELQFIFDNVPFFALAAAAIALITAAVYQRQGF